MNSMLNYYETDEKDLELIEPLWKKLIYHLQSKSTYFSLDYKSLIFEERREQLIKIAESGQLRLDIVTEGTEYMGYCVCSIVDGKGFIDSLFVDQQYRKRGIGNKLMERALNWMDIHSVSDIEILMSFGNDAALGFYEKYGFYTKNMILRKK